MANNHVSHAYLADMQTAHRELACQLRLIEGLLAEGQRHGWTETVTRQVHERLTELVEATQRHFCHEEAGGHLEEAVTRLPRLHGEMQRLLAEHRGLLDQLRQVAQLTAVLAASRSAWPRLAERIAAMLERLRRHEEAENRLMEQGFNVALEDRG